MAPATASSKLPVTTRATLQRVNRALASQGKALRACKLSSRWHGELGAYYEVDTSTNSITAKHVDIEGLARELGLLKPYEVVKE